MAYYNIETEDDDIVICDGYGDYVICLHSDKIIRKYHVGGKTIYFFLNCKISYIFI